MAKIDNGQIADLLKQGIDGETIAAQFGISRGAVYARAVRARRAKQEKTEAAANSEPGFEIIGVTPDSPSVDIGAVWQQAIATQKSVFENLKTRREAQRIKLTPPCALAFLSDIHFGSLYTDYQTAQDDARIVRDTPGMVAGFHGDGVDNWIVGKLLHLQRGQALNFDGEWQLFTAWLEMLKSKLVYVVAGNHENWAMAAAGFDRLREALRGVRVLYHPYQVIFTLEVGQAAIPVKVRHKWPYGSIFNSTHSIEVGWERGGFDFDIGIGGHTHRGTYFRPFTRHGRRRWAVLTGSYKLADEHGEEIGAAPTDGRGCGAFVFRGDGTIAKFEELREAAEFLTFLRKKE